jgi:uncharacterized protein (DUF849 family)
MAHNKKLIITCAITGSGLTPSMSPYLPITPKQIVDEAIGATKAGAAIVHLHVRDPKDGRPTRDLAVWKEVVPHIASGCDAIINMSASAGNTPEERTEASLALRPEIATVIVGSMNYARFKKADDQGLKEYKYDWEKEYFTSEAAFNYVTNNTFGKIDRMIDTFLDNDIAMEFECYDVGHLFILDYHLQKKKLKNPIILQFLTGILGGIPSDIDHLLHMKRTSERLFGDDCELFIHGTGPHNMHAATYGGMMGTHLRVGQEDNLQERPGVLYKSNAEQVEKIKRIMHELNIATATPAEARKILRLPERRATKVA